MSEPNPPKKQKCDTGCCATDAQTADAIPSCTKDCCEDNNNAADEDVEELELNFDQHGRVFPGVQGPVNYGFRAYHDCLNLGHLKQLHGDCETVFTARETEDQEVYSSGQTFFVKANQTDSEIEQLSAPERLALEIFRFHAKDLTYDPAKSGAEWWTLVMDQNDSGVGAHWDKDYGLEDAGVNVYPNISTVTYLSDLGAPTYITQMIAPPQIDPNLEIVKADKLAMVSDPVCGKHISFDGRFLHFADSELKETVFPRKDDASVESTGDNTKRVTFLVNIWFNHLPVEATPLPEATAKQLPRGTTYWVTPQTPSEPHKCALPSTDVDAKELTQEVDGNYDLEYKVPAFTESTGKDMVLIEYTEESERPKIVEAEDESSDEEAEKQDEEGEK